MTEDRDAEATDSGSDEPDSPDPTDAWTEEGGGGAREADAKEEGGASIDHEGEEDGPVEIGDPRLKHVSVIALDGTETTHGDVYLRHSTDEFIVSPDQSFESGQTTRYAKDDVARVTVTQHHSACFITTATAGHGPTLDALRGYRDDALSTNPVGRGLVGVYEAVSPPVAATLAAHPRARTTRFVRWLVYRCASLARRRASLRRGPGRTLLSLLLTLLYVLGVFAAVAGHTAIRVRASLRGRIRQ